MDEIIYPEKSTAELIIQNEIEELTNVRKNYEEQLKLFSLDLECFPDDIVQILNECTANHELCHINTKTLLAFEMYQNKMEKVEFTLAMNKLDKEIEGQQMEIQKTNVKCKELQKFIEDFEKREITKTALMHEKLLLENQKQSLSEKQSAFKFDDLHIMNTLEKLEILKKKNNIEMNSQKGC